MQSFYWNKRFFNNGVKSLALTKKKNAKARETCVLTAAKMGFSTRLRKEYRRKNDPAIHLLACLLSGKAQMKEVHVAITKC